LFTEADRFRPERWQSLAPTPYEYLAFSAGPRGCPGYAFGLAMVKVAVATIMTRRSIELPRDMRLDYKVRITLSPRAAVLATLHRQPNGREPTPIRGTIGQLVRLGDD
jgi:cytochrome P450